MCYTSSGKFVTELCILFAQEAEMGVHRNGELDYRLLRGTSMVSYVNIYPVLLELL